MIKISRGNYKEKVVFVIPFTVITSLVKMACGTIKEVFNEEVDYLTGKCQLSMESYLRDLNFVLTMFKLETYEYKLQA